MNINNELRTNQTSIKSRIVNLKKSFAYIYLHTDLEKTFYVLISEYNKKHNM